jgi:hypothetical protein
MGRELVLIADPNVSSAPSAGPPTILAQAIILVAAQIGHRTLYIAQSHE